jgi:hypothetical protein
MMSINHQGVTMQNWSLHGERVIPNLEGDVIIAKSDA